MQKSLSIGLVLLLLALCGFSQTTYITREGTISFYSSAPLEDIEAVNNRVQAVLSTSTGEISVRMRIEDFQFSRSLMQRHFNERFMESDVYPEARLIGIIEDFEKFSETGIPGEVTVNGKLTIHGVTRDVEITGTLRRSGPHYLCHATFPVEVADYDIEIPRLLIRNIAEVVDVTVDLRLAPLD
jgi:hypothetical protein